MAAVDEYLRHGPATARPRDHRVEAGAVHRHVDFPIGCALAVEQRLRPRAIGAEKFGIDFDRRHAAIPSSFHSCISESNAAKSNGLPPCASGTTRAQHSADTRAAPPRRNVRAAARSVAPLAWTSSIRIRCRPDARAFASFASAKAPATIR